jgi:hypothetical protein
MLRRSREYCFAHTFNERVGLLKISCIDKKLDIKQKIQTKSNLDKLGMHIPNKKYTVRKEVDKELLDSYLT